MPKVRPLNEKKYNINKHRFWELYHFCLQYNNWKTELSELRNKIGVSNINNISFSKNISDITSETTFKIIELEDKCSIIEKTAFEADSIIYKYIIEAVTNENITYNYLRHKGIPCGKDMYYNRRRKFYWLLSKKI